MLRSGHIQDRMGNEPITLADGAILHEPSDNEDPTELPSGTRTLRPPFGDVDPDTDSEGARPPFAKYGGARSSDWTAGRSPYLTSPGRADYEH